MRSYLGSVLILLSFFLCAPVQALDSCHQLLPTSKILLAGNLNASTSVMLASSIPVAVQAGESSTGLSVSYTDLNDLAGFSTVVNVVDSLGTSHPMAVFFFKTTDSSLRKRWTVNAYVNSEEVAPIGSEIGLPRISGAVVLDFETDGTLRAESATSMQASMPWNNGAEVSRIVVDFTDYTQYASPSNLMSVNTVGGEVTPLPWSDSDADGTPDCADECGFDPRKHESGSCGCGEAEIDRNSDGRADCLSPLVSTIPVRPTVQKLKQGIRVRMQAFGGTVLYRLRIESAHGGVRLLVLL